MTYFSHSDLQGGVDVGAARRRGIGVILGAGGGGQGEGEEHRPRRGLRAHLGI